MLKRVLLLCLGIWLIAASGLSAHAGPCTLEKTEVAADEADHAHCDMMAAPDEAPAQETDANCCCPAVLAALPVPVIPEAATDVFTLPADFPPDARALSLNLIPEPPPPKA
jgi:hypothetical protein